MTDTAEAAIDIDMNYISEAMANAVRFAQELLDHIDDTDELTLTEMVIRSMAIDNGLLTERRLTDDEAAHVKASTPDADTDEMVMLEFTDSFAGAIGLLDAAQAEAAAHTSLSDMEVGTI